MFCVEDAGLSGEVPVVDKARLKRSIISWSFVVFTGTGGSGKANALLKTGAVSLVPTNVPCDVGDCVLECLHWQHIKSTNWKQWISDSINKKHHVSFASCSHRGQ